MQDRWVRLVRYLRSCVEREAAGELVAKSNGTRWSITPFTAERLVCGLDHEVPVFPELRDMSSRLGPGQELRYGWPTLLLKDARGVTRIAPLLVIGVDRPALRAETIGATDDEPFLNPALLAGSFFDDDALVGAEAALAGGAGGDPAATTATVRAVLESFGLTSAEVDAEHLYPEKPLRVVSNVAVVTVVEASNFTASLLRELRELEDREDWYDTAAAWLVGVPPPLPLQRTTPVAATVAMNDAQEQAVERLRRDSLTVVTGPPGTGKSQIVAAAVTNAWIDGETALLASTNNAAVNVAVERITSVDPVLVLRTGNKDVRDGLADRLAAAVRVDRGDAPPESVARRDLDLATRRHSEILDAAERLGVLESELADAVLAREEASTAVWSERQPPLAAELVDEVELRAPRIERARLFRRRRARRLLHRAQAKAEAAIGDLAAWSRASAAEKRLRAEESGLAGVIGDLEDALGVSVGARCEASTALLNSVAARRLEAGRETLAALCNANPAAPGFRNWLEKAREVIPAAACTALSMAGNFALEPGIFDLVLVDEASQCTLAAVLPLAFRAKRLGIIGDPNQLTPVVQLDPRQLRSLARANGMDDAVLERRRLDYGRGSAFTAYEVIAEKAGERAIVLLDEHYRSHPKIARWFNDAFYGGALHVLTDVSAMRGNMRGLAWIDVEGVSSRGPRGGASNATEAERVVDWLVDWLDSVADSDASVGVVTPFAAQAARIRERARERLGDEHLAAIEFTSGTAHRFQGNERDVILFSTVVAENTAERTVRWVESQRNLVNVAASRARSLLVVFGHPDPSTRLHAPTLEALHRAAVEGLPDPEASWLVHSEAECRLKDALYERGLAPVLKPTVDGYELDFELRSDDGRRLDLEVDGRHHRDARGRQRRQDLARDRVMRGLGWHVIRVPAWRCLADCHEVAAMVGAWLADASANVTGKD